MKSLFITGTGTGVGKTAVSCGLSRIFTEAGFRTSYMKPVRTGSDTDDDPAFVYAQVPKLHRLSEDMICQYSFPFPASPHVSARLAKAEINPAKIISAYKDITEKEALDILIVEGAGGVYVPLSKKYTMLDLMKELEIPVIVVALGSLGTINHTMLTIEALQRRDIKIAGLIFNMLPVYPGVIEKDNMDTITALSGIEVLSALSETSPGIPPGDSNAYSSSGHFAELIAEEMNRNKILQSIL